MTPAEQSALDAAVAQFPVLLASGWYYGTDHPAVQQRVSDQYEDIVAEYRRIRGEAA